MIYVFIYLLVGCFLAATVSEKFANEVNQVLAVQNPEYKPFTPRECKYGLVFLGGLFLIIGIVGALITKLTNK